jgi:hypothetical protein
MRFDAPRVRDEDIVSPCLAGELARRSAHKNGEQARRPNKEKEAHHLTPCSLTLYAVPGSPGPGTKSSRYS